jgi:hypothetical protein
MSKIKEGWLHFSLFAAVHGSESQPTWESAKYRTTAKL